MITQNIDGISFKMRSVFDFSFLSKYGTVFKVFDSQDSGNICFGVRKDGGRYFIKFAGAPTDEYDGKAEDAIARMKEALPVYENIRHKNLIEYMYSEEIGGGMAMVFKWADGKCMGRMYPEDHACIMALPVFDKIRIFDSIIDFADHTASVGYAAVDFYDGSIMYDEKTGITTVCDIDFFQKRPYINTMGHMWGSPRFMSPEEYQKGAVIDEITNVFTLGQMAFSLFTDSDREKEAWPLSEKSYQVLQKAISPEKYDRYQSIKDFWTAWKAAL